MPEQPKIEFEQRNVTLFLGNGYALLDSGDIVKDIREGSRHVLAGKNDIVLAPPDEHTVGLWHPSTDEKGEGEGLSRVILTGPPRFIWWECIAPKDLVEFDLEADPLLNTWQLKFPGEFLLDDGAIWEGVFYIFPNSYEGPPYWFANTNESMLLHQQTPEFSLLLNNAQGKGAFGKTGWDKKSYPYEMSHLTAFGGVVTWKFSTGETILKFAGDEFPPNTTVPTALDVTSDTNEISLVATIGDGGIYGTLEFNLTTSPAVVLQEGLNTIEAPCTWILDDENLDPEIGPEVDEVLWDDDPVTSYDDFPRPGNAVFWYLQIGPAYYEDSCEVASFERHFIVPWPPDPDDVISQVYHGCDGLIRTVHNVWPTVTGDPMPPPYPDSATQQRTVNAFYTEQTPNCSPPEFACPPDHDDSNISGIRYWLSRKNVTQEWKFPYREEGDVAVDPNFATQT
jgi:hypothetical protein